MLEPVGRLPSGVYWRRRAVVLVVALAVVALAGWAAVAAAGLRPGPSAHGPAALSASDSGPVTPSVDPRSPRTHSPAARGTQPAHSPVAPTSTPVAVTPTAADRLTPAAAPTPPPVKTTAAATTPPATAPTTTSPTAVAPTTAKTAPTTTSAPSAVPPTSASPAARECAAADLRLTVGTDRPDYHVGDQPGITLDLVNVSSTACVGDFGPVNQDAKVYARSNRLWSSNDCHHSDDRMVVSLRPGEHFRYTIKWAGYTSLPGCAPSHIQVGAGIYQAYGAVAGLRGAAPLWIWPAEPAGQRR